MIVSTLVVNNGEVVVAKVVEVGAVRLTPTTLVIVVDSVLCMVVAVV
jgi:hypothetical protein